MSTLPSENVARRVQLKITHLLDLLHASGALAVHLVPLRLAQGAGTLPHINRLRSAQNLVRIIRVRVKHQLQGLCGEVKDPLLLQPRFDVSARSASPSPRLTLPSLAPPPSAPTPILPVLDTNPSTPPAARHQLAPWLVLRGTRLAIWKLTAKNTKVLIKATLVPRQPSNPFASSSTMIPLGASTYSALASKNPPLVPTVRTRRCSGQGGLLPPPLSPSSMPSSWDLAGRRSSLCREKDFWKPWP